MTLKVQDIMAGETFEGTPNPLVVAAEKAIAAKFGLAEDAVRVTIGRERENLIGYARPERSPDDLTVVNVSMSVAGALLDETAKDKAKATFKEWEPTKNWEWDSRYEQMQALQPKLDQVKSLEGFNTELLSSPVLQTKPDKKEMLASVQDYAFVEFSLGDYGAEVTLRPAYIKDVDSKPMLEKMAASINDPAQNTQIKDVLEQRVLKNLKLKLLEENVDATKIEAELAKAKANMANLIIKASIDDKWSDGVRITMRSPQQAEAAKTIQNPQYASSDNGVALRAENPLSLLDYKITEKNPHPALQKSLARALFYDKDKKVRSEMIPFMGTIDLKAALAKEFSRLSAANPDKAALFNEIVGDDFFKLHEARQEKNVDAGAPNATISTKSGRSDMIKVELPLKQSEIKALLESMAGVSVAAAPADVAPQVAPTDTAAALSAVDQKVANDMVAAAVAGGFAAKEGAAVTASSLAAQGPKSLLERATSAVSSSLGLSA